jgi:hypothetical protein
MQLSRHRAMKRPIAKIVARITSMNTSLEKAVTARHALLSRHTIGFIRGRGMNDDHPTFAAQRVNMAPYPLVLRPEMQAQVVPPTLLPEPDTRLAWWRAIAIAFAACSLFWLILWAAWVELP